MFTTVLNFSTNSRPASASLTGCLCEAIMWVHPETYENDEN